MEIFVNGISRSVQAGTSIAQLLGQLQLESRHVAVEVNLELAPRGRHAEHALQPGDHLEVVTLVGGG